MAHLAFRVTDTEERVAGADFLELLYTECLPEC